MATRKKLVILLGIMAILVVISTIIIHLSKDDRRYVKDSGENQGKIQVVTTFYPMYIIGLNVADHMDNVEVTNLTDMNTGCVHDYQLTTDNMKLLSDADVIIVNGGGLEGFLDEVISNYPNLRVIDSSKGISMLAYDGHEEGESHETIEDHDGNHEEAGEENEEHHEHGDYNPHIWLDPQAYVKQIGNVRDGLTAYIQDRNAANQLTENTTKELTTEIEQNAAAYIEKVLDLDRRISEIHPQSNLRNGEESADQGVAIFHDSFAYLAERLGLKVAYAVEIDSESALSASDIAQIIDLVKEGKIHYLFAENLYGDMITARIKGETGVEVTLMDPIVTGDGSKDSYINAMEKNIELLKTMFE
jgi:zinc transport system substrate-binding protein